MFGTDSVSTLLHPFETEFVHDAAFFPSLVARIAVRDGGAARTGRWSQCCGPCNPHKASKQV